MEVNAYWVILLFAAFLLMPDLAWAICAVVRRLTPHKEKESSTAQAAPD
jgi:predicted Na+-dependent transporter